MEREPWARTRTLTGLVLAGAMCMTCYSLGWHCGNLNSNSEYDHRLAEMHRLMDHHRNALHAALEEGEHARSEE